MTGKRDKDDAKDKVEVKDIANMTEEERIAELGKPRLGEIDKISIQIKESMEFKVLFTMAWAHFSTSLKTKMILLKYKK